MRDGMRPYTVVYLPKDASQKISDPDDADALRRRALRRGRLSLIARPVGGVYAGRLHFCLSGRARNVHVRRRIRVRPPARPEQKNALKRLTNRATLTTPSPGWSKTSRTTTGEWASGGFLVLGFYTATALMDAHPALKAASPQALIADWFVGDDDHHNGAFFLFDCFGFNMFFGMPRSDRPRINSRASITGRRTSTNSSSNSAPWPLAEEIFQRQEQILERRNGARDLRRVLAGPQRPPSFEKGHASGDGGRRMVRRRGFVRAAEYLSDDREEQSRGEEHSGDGAVVARAMVGAGTARAWATFISVRRPRSWYRENVELLLEIST